MSPTSRSSLGARARCRAPCSSPASQSYRFCRSCSRSSPSPSSSASARLHDRVSPGRARRRRHLALCGPRCRRLRRLDRRLADRSDPPCDPADGPAAGSGDLDRDRPSRSRALAATFLVLGVRDWRIAGWCCCGRPHRLVPDRECQRGAGTPRRARMAISGSPGHRRRDARAQRWVQVLPVADRRLVRGHASSGGGNDRNRNRLRLAPARHPVHRRRRLHATRRQSQRHVRRGLVHPVRPARRARATGPAARTITVALGAAVFALAWRRKSLALAIATAFILSPIVWRHYFVVLAVPLAVSFPGSIRHGRFHSASGSCPARTTATPGRSRSRSRSAPQQSIAARTPTIYRRTRPVKPVVDAGPPMPCSLTALHRFVRPNPRSYSTHERVVRPRDAT